MAQDMETVADAQDRHAQVQNFRIQGGGSFIVDPRGPAGEDNALRSKLTNFIQGHEEGMYFAIDFEFPHPPGDELGILGPEVQNKYFFLMGIAHFSSGNSRI